MIKFVYKILPVYVRYVDSIPTHAGLSFGPYIKIEKAYKDDVGLLHHELTHSRQCYRTLGLWWILNRISKFRYKYEVEAYRVQLRYVRTGWDQTYYAAKFAGFIVDNYGLDVSQARALEDLIKP